MLFFFTNLNLMEFQVSTTGIQPRPDAFDESRFIMTFLIILGITEILYSFKLVLEGKTGKEIPESSRLEFLEKFLANNFALSDAEGNSSSSLNRGGIAVLPLLRSLQAIHREPSFWEMMDSFLLLPYTGLAASRTFIQQLLTCLNFRFRRFILLIQTKKVNSMNYDSSTSS